MTVDDTLGDTSNEATITLEYTPESPVADDDAETNVNALSPSEAVNMSSKDNGDNLLSLPRYDANHWAE